MIPPAYDFGIFPEHPNPYIAPEDRPDYDPTAWTVGLSRGELKELSKVGGIPIIYGERQVQGVTIYLEERKGATTGVGVYIEGGDWQHSLIVSEGEIDGVDLITLNDSAGFLLTGNDGNGWTKGTPAGVAYEMWVKVYTGSDSQSANASDTDVYSFTYGNSNTETPNTSWSAEHTLSGVAHIDIYYKKHSNFEDYPNKKLPKIKLRVQGLSSGTKNPAVILKDYLTNTRYGCSIPADEIDDDSFSTFESFCNESVDSGYGYTKRHECNVILDSQATLIQNIKIILASCNGQLHWVDGKYKLHIDKLYQGLLVGSELQVGVNAFDFDESHIIGGLKVIGERKSQRANQVIAKFVNRRKINPTDSSSAESFKEDEVSWPDLSSSTYSTFLSEDNNVPLKKEITLKSITKYHQARFLAQQACLLSRNSMGVEFNATAEALELTVGDVVSVTHTTPGWDAKKFIVRHIGINPNGTVNVSGTEYQAGTYIWDQAYAPPEIPDTNIPNPNDIEAPTALRWTEDTYSAIASAGLRVQIQLTWVHDQEFQLASGYDFEYKKTADTDWLTGGSSTSKSGIINDFEKGFFDFRVRAKTVTGTVSDWYTIENQNIQGSIYPPQAVTGFAVSNFGSNVVLSWDSPTDGTDVDHIAIGVLQEGSTVWNDAIIVGKVGAGNTSITLPAMDGNYVAKWVNSSGKESEAYIASGEVTVQGITNVATFAEQQAWAGTMDGFYKDTISSGGTPIDVLKFLGGALVDTVTELMDTWPSIDGLGGRTAPAVYTGTVRDLGAVLPARVSTDATFTSIVTDGSNHMDFWGKVDLRDSWDDKLKLDALKFEVRTTNDNPADVSATWTSWKPFIIIDVLARGFQMRATFTEFDVYSQLTLEELELIVDMIEKFESERAKTATSITFPTPFYTTPDLTVTPINMGTGDYMTISSETKDGFGINFYNSSGASQTRTYNYIARGV